MKTEMPITIVYFFLFSERSIMTKSDTSDQHIIKSLKIYVLLQMCMTG